MSFILDALKKSESERVRKRSPDISDVPVAAHGRRSPRWLWLIGVLLVVNAIALTALLLRPQESSQPAGPAAEPATAAPANPPEPAARPLPAAVSATGTAPDEPRASRQPETEPRPEPRDEPSPQSDVAPAAVEAEPAPRRRPVETLLTFNDVRASGAADIPDLHIDLHVYSDSAPDRFVFINMNQYRESAVLSEGPTLREITPEGVVLEYRGTTFLLPRE